MSCWERLTPVGKQCCMQNVSRYTGCAQNLLDIACPPARPPAPHTKHACVLIQGQLDITIFSCCCEPRARIKSRCSFFEMKIREHLVLGAPACPHTKYPCVCIQGQLDITIFSCCCEPRARIK
ncbi:hypothetical protein KP509_13G080500 [Ceratopteris richardii]|uniref:Uncharacterized protein n=1 Tax=Ceratopteris richardii TaxID=49495 RepID=A0A8T2TH30_CERRI|nr:hypothetical protein KP509_13G080500 [Ceratopteris richardii]